MVTLKDISKECGVSLTQVSRAINDHSDVSEATKKLVLQTATDMGYVKNIFAQNLARNTPNQIAFIVKGIQKDDNLNGSTNIYKLMQGMQKFADEFDYDCAVYLFNDRDVSYVNFCKQRYINGIVIFGADYDDSNFKDLIASDLPCVVIDINIEGKKKGCVTINDVYHSQLAVTKLLDSGCKRIALLTGHDYAFVTLQRKIGYQMALTQKNIPLDVNIIANANFEQDTAYQKTIELLQKNPDIDAFFCMSDHMAMGCINAILSLGKRIPEDISVIGFDGISIGELITPSLSTVKQNPFRKGYLAAKLLTGIISQEAEEKTIVVPCTLELRGSTKNIE